MEWNDNRKLYFIGGAGLIKVGVTTYSASARLAELQTGSPVGLVILAECDNYRMSEKEIHRALEPYCVHGEWFEPNYLLCQIVEEVIELNPQSRYIKAWEDFRMNHLKEVK